MIHMEQRVSNMESTLAEVAHIQLQTEIALKENRLQMEQDARRREQDARRREDDTRRMKKAWGDLANKMGTIVEDVVLPNIPRLAITEFGFSEVEDLMPRVQRTSRHGEKRWTEYDVVCAGPGKVVVVEVKSTPTLDKIREVPERLAAFFDFFPEYKGRELIGVFASWSIDPRLHAAIREAGLYGIAMGEDTMEVVVRPAG